MKYDPQKAFPYPVLRPENDDYVGCEFKVTSKYEMQEDGKTLKLDIDYDLSCTAIENEIKTGNAEYVSMISCRSTYFRSTLFSKERTHAIQFDIGQLRGEVNIEPYIVVRKDINIYKSSQLNKEYGAGPFIFSTGDILAQGAGSVIYVDRDCFKPVTSVFDLVKKEDLSDAEWKLSFSQEHVNIEVSPTTKEKIDNARNSKVNRSILVNSIYFAAVMQAIQRLKDYRESGDYDQYKWANVIRSQISNGGWDIVSQDSYLLAEQLLKRPLSLLSLYVFKGSE